MQSLVKCQLEPDSLIRADVTIVFSILYLATYAFMLLLFARFVLDWVQFFVHDWRPRGFLLIVAETVYSVTDPPLRALRSVLPPLTLGAVRLDLAFLILAMACSILLFVFRILASG